MYGACIVWYEALPARTALSFVGATSCKTASVEGSYVPEVGRTAAPALA